MTQGERDKQFYEQRASDEMARHFLSADYDTRRSAKTRARGDQVTETRRS